MKQVLTPTMGKIWLGLLGAAYIGYMIFCFGWGFLLWIGGGVLFWWLTCQAVFALRHRSDSQEIQEFDALSNKQTESVQTEQTSVGSAP